MGKPLKALLRSIDVLHDFTVPQFRVKMDLVPGLVTYVWFTPTRTGKFDLLCEELCGIAHFTMRGKVVVEEEPAFAGVVERLSDVRANDGAGARRSRGGPGALRCLCRLPWRAGGGQSGAECAEAERAGGLVPETATAATSRPAPVARTRRTRSAR